MSRKAEQAELIFKAGQLFGPLLAMIEHPDSYDSDEKTRSFARYAVESKRFLVFVRAFTASEPGHDYVAQYTRINSIIIDVTHAVTQNPPGHSVVTSAVITAAKVVTDTILAIPVPIDSMIYESCTPFSTYCNVKDLCSTPKAEVIWLDRYFDQTLFHRYFANTPPNVLITLVTLPESSCKGARDVQRYADFIDISKLFAQQRGTHGYRLVTNDNFHDRWLSIDDRLFALGGSIKDISKETTFTLSRLDGTPENRKHFDNAIANGVEVFGITQPNHP